VFIALSLFLGAILTDVYDGWVARTKRTETTWGKFMDPLADKLLVLSSFTLFIDIQYLRIPSWMVTLIIIREFSITALRLIGMAKGTIIAAAIEGKIKTSVQMFTIIIILGIILLKESRIELRGFLLLLSEWTPFALTSITMVLTLFSGIIYLFRHKELILSIHE
jgi:CDP-diacylglycerol--glycerol-3-phosphate 3-phosphatidyltransferase